MSLSGCLPVPHLRNPNLSTKSLLLHVNGKSPCFVWHPSEVPSTDSTEAHMHHKFAIADNDLLLTGSYNWTRSASTENNENVIVTNHEKLVAPFREEFDKMWRALGR